MGEDSSRRRMWIESVGMTVGQWLDLYDAGERETAGRLLLVVIGRCSRGPAQRLRVDPDDLEDVVVERVTRGRGFAYLRAVRADVSLQGAMGRFAWLGACDIARARARRAGHLPDVWRLHRLGKGDLPEAGRHAQQQESARELRRAIETLPHPYSTVLRAQLILHLTREGIRALLADDRGRVPTRARVKDLLREARSRLLAALSEPPPPLNDE